MVQRTLYWIVQQRVGGSFNSILIGGGRSWDTYYKNEKIIKRRIDLLACRIAVINAVMLAQLSYALVVEIVDIVQ